MWNAMNMVKSVFSLEMLKNWEIIFYNIQIFICLNTQMEVYPLNILLKPLLLTLITSYPIYSLEYHRETEKIKRE